MRERERESALDTNGIQSIFHFDKAQKIKLLALVLCVKTVNKLRPP